MSAIESLTSSLSPASPAAVVPADGHVGELLAHQLVAPVHEGALGELLDVALVHHGDRRPAVLEGVVDGGADQALGAHLGDRLDPDARAVADRPAHLVTEEGHELEGLGSALLHLVAGVDVLGVLPEDDHVDQLGVQDRRGHAREPAHRPQADVEVEDLAQRHVERADAAADRRGERALDPDQVVPEALDRLVGEPVAGLVERLLAGQDLLPGHLVAVLGRGGIEHQLGRGPDVDPRAVALDEGDDGLVGDSERTVGAHGDFLWHFFDARGWGGGVPIEPHHRAPAGWAIRPPGRGAPLSPWRRGRVPGRGRRRSPGSRWRC